MSRVILLDAGTLGVVTQRRGAPIADACREWVTACIRNGAVILVPEVADYEVRRELLRAGKAEGLRRLDEFNAAEPAR